MSKRGGSRKQVASLLATVVVVVAIIGGLALSHSGTSPNTALTPAESVLSPAYARSVGFSKTYRAAAKEAVTNEKGCTSSVEAVYEDTATTTGLISDLLHCKSVSSASAVLAAFRKQVHIDGAISVPSQLGASAFATASNAPEYLVAWQVGSGVALLALDTDTAASSSSAKAPPISKSQTKVLEESAVQQNSLYS
jgi:hypothetical protein